MSGRSREWLKCLLMVPSILLGVLVLAWQLGHATRPLQAKPEEVKHTVRVIEVELVTFIPLATG